MHNLHFCNLLSVLFPKINGAENTKRIAKKAPRNGQNAAMLKVKLLSKNNSIALMSLTELKAVKNTS